MPPASRRRSNDVLAVQNSEKVSHPSSQAVKKPGYRDVVYDRFRESIKVPSLQFPPKPGHGLLFPYHDHLVPDRDHDHRDLHHGLRGVRRLSVLGLWLVAL